MAGLSVQTVLGTEHLLSLSETRTPVRRLFCHPCRLRSFSSILSGYNIYTKVSMERNGLLYSPYALFQVQSNHDFLAAKPYSKGLH